MKNSNLWIRTAVCIAVTVFGIYLVIGPRGSITAKDFTWNGIKENVRENINLGLDLRGGSHLVVRVKTEEYLKKLTIENQDAAFNAAKEAKLPVSKSSFVADPGTYNFTVEYTDANQADAIAKAIREKVDVQLWTETRSGNSISYSLSGTNQRQVNREATEQAKQIITSRIDAFGVKEPTIQTKGQADSGEILIQMPGIDDPERIKEILKATAQLSLMKVVSPPNPNLQTYPTKEAALQSIGGAESASRKVFKYTERDDNTADDQTPPEQWIVVEYPAIIEGDQLRGAQATSATGNINDYQISFQLKPEGAVKFRDWTGKNINNYMAVVLGDDRGFEAKSVAYISSQIYDQGQISGQFTKDTAEDLALTLRSGALPTQIEYLEERTVGPSLGADSIESGVTAAGGGLIFVICFMLFYYRGAGINAVIALMLNMLLTLAAIVVLQSTLTLPGIAGLILGIGMAVDSNVLIFERMREELKDGKIVSKAIEIGFQRAFITIIDTHLTTIIAAGILYLYGSGPIRGFAVTLTLGLIINLFSAVYVSRTIFLWLIQRNPNKTKLSV